MIEPVLIIGNGTCAGALAETFLQTGMDVILVSRDVVPEGTTSSLPESRPSKNMEILTHTELLGCSGTIGRFKVRFQSNHSRMDRTVSAIIIAEEHRFLPNYSQYGLTHCQSLLSLTQFNQLISSASRENGQLAGVKKIVFLSGLKLESHPVISERIMRLSLRLHSEFGIQTYVLTGNLKVAGPGLEDFCRQSKIAGSVYVKFTSDRPQIIQSGGTVTCVFNDEISGHRYELTPDITVVDETILPSAHLARLAEVLKIDMGPGAYIQTDNVRRVNLWTNRKGILAAGPSRGVFSENDCRADAECAALAVLQLVTAGAAVVESPGHAVIDTEKCIHCLTCYRVCPHQAITLDIRPEVASDSCETCGLCVSECPQSAITLTGPGIPDPDRKPALESDDTIFEPHLLAMCCDRSAIPAWKLSLLQGHRQPRQFTFISVPCGAGVSKNLIYRLFLQGADGIMIITCHPGNCHSEQGQRYALQEAAQAGEFFQQIGFEGERLCVETIAANMGAEFSEKAARFADMVRKLGPSRLKKV